MEALAARGDVAEALRAYEDLRVRLRDELGTIPDPAVRAVHVRLLTERPPPPERPARDERKLVTVLALERDAREELERLEATIRPDGVAVFGVPRAHEDDAERAVEAALRIAAAPAWRPARSWCATASPRATSSPRRWRCSARPPTAPCSSTS